MSSWPERPEAARLKGASLRSGHWTTEAVTSLKLVFRELVRRVARSERGGGERMCFLMGREVLFRLEWRG
jgi:hypothetical protein